MPANTFLLLLPTSIFFLGTHATQLKRCLGILQTVRIMHKDLPTLHPQADDVVYVCARVTSIVELRPQPVTTFPLLSTVSSNSVGSKGSFVTWNNVEPASAWNHLQRNQTSECVGGSVAVKCTVPWCDRQHAEKKSDLKRGEGSEHETTLLKPIVGRRPSWRCYLCVWGLKDVLTTQHHERSGE